MHIIIGLGNPGREYDGTRHNIGWEAITQLSDDHQIPLDFLKHKAMCGKGIIDGERIILAKPTTYMNLSGESVRELMDFYKVAKENIIIIYDDISLDVGQIRIRRQGTDGGQRGIKSIIQHLGTNEFPRIKIGIGNKPQGWDLADYVLSRFKNDEESGMKEAVEEATKACRTIIKDGIDSAMNQHNKKK